MTVRIYGIKNCDTMKKAFQWLDARKIPYDFHDYKKAGIDKAVVARAIKEQGWENVLNRKGTTWRALPEDAKAAITDTKAAKLAEDNPSILRRPLLMIDKEIVLGFDEKIYAAFFKAK